MIDFSGCVGLLLGVTNKYLMCCYGTYKSTYISSENPKMLLCVITFLIFGGIRFPYQQGTG
jgi:hypothetical protein